MDITVYKSNIIIQVYKRDYITWCKYPDIGIKILYLKYLILYSLNSLISFFFLPRKYIYILMILIKQNKIYFQRIINTIKLLFQTLSVF